MRWMMLGGAMAALAVSGCEERHLRGIVGVPGGDGSASVRILVVDDPAGAEPVLSGGSRPTVAVRFSTELLRPGLSADVPDTGTLVAQAAIGLTGDLVTTTDSVPASTYEQVRLTLTEATLAMAGALPVDLLESAPSLSITRDVSREVDDGELLTVRVDLNSDAWLVPNPSPGASPEFLFTGTGDFLSAIEITLP